MSIAGQIKISDIESVEQNLYETRTQQTELEEHIRTHEASAVGINLIVRWVMVTYSFSILGCILYLSYRGISSNEDMFDSIAEIIKVAVVPVATFVIGYCFARECGREGIHFEEVERD